MIREINGTTTGYENENGNGNGIDSDHVDDKIIYSIQLVGVNFRDDA